jgi:probable F420-dependent oxidoreductase
MTTTDELREALGRTGIWMRPPAQIGLDAGEYARAIEGAGFGSVWVARVDTTADLEAMEPLLSATGRLVAATGIANVWTWRPAELAAQADALAGRHPGRFILGLGVSHAPLVESTGQAYVRPLAKMREFLGALPAGRAPVVLAALGPKMLELSRDRTLGAHPYLSPPEHTAFARSVLGAAPLLVPEQAVSLAGGSEGQAAGRAYAKYYLELPNYVSNLRRFGFGEEDVTGGGSDKLISAIIPAGPEAVRARVREHLDAGADHVVIQPVAEDGRFAAGHLDELASIVADLLRPVGTAGSPVGVLGDGAEHAVSRRRDVEADGEGALQGVDDEHLTEPDAAHGMGGPVGAGGAHGKVDVRQIGEGAPGEGGDGDHGGAFFPCRLGDSDGQRVGPAVADGEADVAWLEQPGEGVEGDGVARSLGCAPHQREVEHGVVAEHGQVAQGHDEDAPGPGQRVHGLRELVPVEDRRHVLDLLDASRDGPLQGGADRVVADRAVGGHRFAHQRVAKLAQPAVAEALAGAHHGGRRGAGSGRQLGC